MKIFIKSERSIIHNNDIKWYLANQMLWISRKRNYNEIEQILAHSYGSFNWLYNINDTLLFCKEDGKLMTLIINIPNTIRVEQIYGEIKCIKENGDLYLDSKNNFDFAFYDDVIYEKEKNCLVSFPEKCRYEDKLSELSITEDMSVYINDSSLIGWKLTNASQHLCISDSDILEECKDRDLTDLLSKYLNGIITYEENGKDNDLKDILNSVYSSKSICKMAIKESILSFLE